MFNANQALVVNAKKVEPKNKAPFYIMSVVYNDAYNALTCENKFTSEDVVKQFDGVGIYDVSTNIGGAIIGIKKVRSVTL